MRRKTTKNLSTRYSSSRDYFIRFRFKGRRVKYASFGFWQPQPIGLNTTGSAHSRRLYNTGSEDIQGRDKVCHLVRKMDRPSHDNSAAHR